jgi:hypothetical protein
MRDLENRPLYDNTYKRYIHEVFISDEGKKEPGRMPPSENVTDPDALTATMIWPGAIYHTYLAVR